MLGGLGFLFPFQAAHSMPVPHGAAVQCWSDGLNNCQRGRIPHVDQLPRTAQYHVHQDWEVVCLARWTQPYPDWRKQAAGRAASTWHVGRVQNPQLFQLGHFLSCKQFQIPWRAGKNQIYGSEGSNSVEWYLLLCGWIDQWTRVVAQYD